MKNLNSAIGLVGYSCLTSVGQTCLEGKASRALYTGEAWLSTHVVHLAKDPLGLQVLAVTVHGTVACPGWVDSQDKSNPYPHNTNYERSIVSIFHLTLTMVLVSRPRWTRPPEVSRKNLERLSDLSKMNELRYDMVTSVARTGSSHTWRSHHHIISGYKAGFILPHCHTSTLSHCHTMGSQVRFMLSCL